MYTPNSDHYSHMQYRKCGDSGLRLPLISLGLWQNFGDQRPYDNSRAMLLRAFDLGITHFDIANNYGPSGGSAELTFGGVLKNDLKPYRDEIIVSTKAGFYMWPGPYGDGGSRKYLISSIDQSLKRTGLDYFDIFYHHRPDDNTPMEETADALAQIVRSGRALYAGISNYPADKTRKMHALMAERGVRLLIHQPSYSMLNRWVEDGLLDALDEVGMGSIAFCPLDQGVLTSKYISGNDGASRFKPGSSQISEERVEKVRKLSDVALGRGQTMAQMALAWVLRGGRVTSALIGASRVEQIEENVRAIDNQDFSEEELAKIREIVK